MPFYGSVSPCSSQKKGVFGPLVTATYRRLERRGLESVAQGRGYSALSHLFLPNHPSTPLAKGFPGDW